MTNENTNKNSQETMDFEAMMEQRIQSNFTAPGQKVDVSNERLKEMNKKFGMSFLSY